MTNKIKEVVSKIFFVHPDNLSFSMKTAIIHTKLEQRGEKIELV